MNFLGLTFPYNFWGLTQQKTECKRLLRVICILFCTGYGSRTRDLLRDRRPGPLDESSIAWFCGAKVMKIRKFRSVKAKYFSLQAIFLIIINLEKPWID